MTDTVLPLKDCANCPIRHRAVCAKCEPEELVAIAASLTAKCQGCLEGHVKKALKFGASREEISEAIAIAIGVNAAAVVDLTDIAADNLSRLLPSSPHGGGP